MVAKVLIVLSQWGVTMWCHPFGIQPEHWEEGILGSPHCGINESVFYLLCVCHWCHPFLPPPTKEPLGLGNFCWEINNAVFCKMSFPSPTKYFMNLHLSISGKHFRIPSPGLRSCHLLLSPAGLCPFFVVLLASHPNFILSQVSCDSPRNLLKILSEFKTIGTLLTTCNHY